MDSILNPVKTIENVSDSKIIDSSHLDKWVLKERWGKDFKEVKSNLQTLLPNAEISVDSGRRPPTEAQDLPPILDRSADLLDFKSRDGEDIFINDTRLQSIRASAQGLEDTLEKYPNLRDTIASVTFNYENAASGQLGSTTAAFELAFEVDAQIGRVMLTDPETGEFNSGIRRTDDGFAIWPMSEYPDNEKETTAIFQPLVDRREDIINSSYLTAVHEMGHIATFGQEYLEGFNRLKEEIDNSDLGNKEMPTTIPQRMDDVMNNNARGFDSVSNYASTKTSETIAEGVAYSHLYAMNDGKNMPFDDPNAKESAALMGASDGTRYYVAPGYQDPLSPNPIVAWVSKESLAEAEEIREVHHQYAKAVEAEKDSSISISSLAASASPYQEIFKLIYAPPAIGSVQAAVENNNWDLLFTSLTAAFNPDQPRGADGRWGSGGEDKTEAKTGKVDISEIKPGADLSGRDLSGMDLRGVSLQGVNLSYANLKGAILTGADLRDANLIGADLRDAKLLGALLNNAVLHEANLQAADLTNANLSNTDFTEANLANATAKDADFSGANLRYAQLAGADLSKTNFDKADLRETDLIGVNLHNADLRNANLSDANLRNADLSGAKLLDANFTEANLYSADLSGASAFETNFTEANLANANFSGAELLYANFTHAELTRANFIEAILTDANLSYANLTSADFSEAKLSGADLSFTNMAKTELSYANLHSANLQGAYLSGAYLSSADLRSTDLQGANLRYADLESANLGNANLTGANLLKADLTDADFKGANLTRAEVSGATVTGANFTDAKFKDSNWYNVDTTHANLSENQLNIVKESTPPLNAGIPKEINEAVASSIKDELSAKKDAVLTDEEFDGDSYSARISTGGNEVGVINFSVNDGTLTLDKIVIDKEFQDQNIAEAVVTAVRAEAENPQNGIDFVYFHANISVGGYSWAKYAYPTETDWSGSVRSTVEERIQGLEATEAGKNIDFSNVKEALASDDPRSIKIIHDDKTLLPDSLVQRSTKGNELGRELLLGTSWHALIATNLAEVTNELAASGATDKSSWMPDVPEKDLAEWIPWPCYVDKDGSVTDEGIWENLEGEDFSDVKRTKDFSYWPITLAFNPDQERDENGRWSSGGSSENKEIEKIVKAVKDNEGYSVKPLTGEVPKDGYMVAVPNTSQTMPAEDFFSEKGIQAVANEIKDFIESNEAAFDGGAWLGLWHAKADGIIVFDVVDQIASRSEAIQQGIARDQISIYDVVNEVEIQTGGTGGLTASGQTRSFRNPTGQEMVGNDLGRKKRVDSENSRAFRGGSKQSLAFDPDQPRDADGKWGSGGGSAPEPKTGKVDPSEIKPGADLSGRDLSGMDLYGMDFTGVNLTGANLRGANLRNAKLDGANLRDANLTNADLQDASLKNADLNYAYLTNAKLEGANLRDANLNGADLEDANLFNATLIDATITNANLRDANLYGARLTSANLRATDLSSADLSVADLSYTNLTDANLSYANLSNGNLSMSKLEGTDLSYADLTSARLIMTSLTDADLRYVNLTNADLQDATVTDVNFTGANLTGTDFKDAIVTNADFTDAIVTGSNLFLTNLDSVTLSPEQKQTIEESKGSGLIAIEGVSSAIGEELGKKDIALKDIDYDDSDYEAKIYNANDDYLGRISFSVNEGILDLGLIQLEAEFQDQGTAETIQLAVMAEAFDPENGIDFVAFHANIDIGGYAWAKTSYPTEESWEKVKGFVSGQIDYMKQTDEGADIDFSNVEKALASDDPRAIQIIHDDKTILPDDLISKSTKGGNELGRELLLDSDWYAIMPTDQETYASVASRLAASGAVDKSSWMPNVPERDLSEWLPWPCYVNKDGSVTDKGIWENLGEEDFSDVKRTKDFSYWPITLAFNPDQERDAGGKWTSGGDEPSWTVSLKTFEAAIETYSKDELAKRWGTSIKDLKNNLSTLLPKANIKASLPNANSKARSNAQGGLSDDYFKDGETVVPTQEIRLLAMQSIAQGIEDVVLLQPNLAEQITEVNMFFRFSDSGGAVLGYTTATNGLGFNIESQMTRLLEKTDYSSDWSKEKENGFITNAFTIASHEMGHIATNSATYESLFATPPLVGPRADGYGELAAGATSKMLNDFPEALAKDFPVVSRYAATSADERIAEAFALNSLLQKTTDSGAPKNNAAESVNNLLKSISPNTTYYATTAYKSDVEGNLLYVSRDSLLEAERASLAGRK